MQRLTRCALPAGLIITSVFVQGCDVQGSSVSVVAEDYPTRLAQVSELKEYYYTNGSLLLVEGRSTADEILTSTWYQLDGTVLFAVDWRHTLGGQTGAYLYLDPERGGIRSIHYYLNGTIHGAKLRFDPPVDPSEIEYFTNGTQIDMWPDPETEP